MEANSSVVIATIVVTRCDDDVGILLRPDLSGVESLIVMKREREQHYVREVEAADDAGAHTRC